MAPTLLVCLITRYAVPNNTGRRWAICGRVKTKRTYLGKMQSRQNYNDPFLTQRSIHNHPRQPVFFMSTDRTQLKAKEPSHIIQSVDNSTDLNSQYHTARRTSLNHGIIWKEILLEWTVCIYDPIFLLFARTHTFKTGDPLPEFCNPPRYANALHML